MSSRETFCSNMQQVVCEDCPLRGVTEQQWRQAVQKGVAPFSASNDVGRIVLEVYDGLTPGPLGTEPSFDKSCDDIPELTLEELQYVMAGDELSGPPLSEITATTAVYDLQITTLIRTVYTGNILGRDAFLATTPEGPVVKKTGECVSKQYAGNCSLEALYSPVAPAFATLVDAKMGANVLMVLARHGSKSGVRDMAAKVHETLLDALDRLELGARGVVVDFHTLPEHACRSYLMRIAGVLESRILNTDDPSTLD